MQAQSVEDGYDGFDLPEDDDYYDSAREDGSSGDLTAQKARLEERLTSGVTERMWLGRSRRPLEGENSDLRQRFTRGAAEREQQERLLQQRLLEEQQQEVYIPSFSTDSYSQHPYY